MSFSIRFTQSIVEGDTSFGGGARTFTVATVLKLEETIADSVTDQEHLLAIDISQLKVFYMVSDQALTVDTNIVDPGQQEKFTLVANQPVTFETGETAIFAGDVTKLFLTNASGSTATLSLIAGLDV